RSFTGRGSVTTTSACATVGSSRRSSDPRLLAAVAEADGRGMTRPDRSVSRQTTKTPNEGYVMPNFRLVLGGRLAPGAGARAVTPPATGGTLAAAPGADRAQRERAGAAAKAAFPAWSATPLRQRAALLVRLAEGLEAEQGEFAHLLTQE